LAVALGAEILEFCDFKSAHIQVEFISIVHASTVIANRTDTLVNWSEIFGVNKLSTTSYNLFACLSLWTQKYPIRFLKKNLSDFCWSYTGVVGVATRVRSWSLGVKIGLELDAEDDNLSAMY
jgi:hypothetical protein